MERIKDLFGTIIIIGWQMSDRQLEGLLSELSDNDSVFVESAAKLIKEAKNKHGKFKDFYKEYLVSKEEYDTLVCLGYGL